MTTAYAAEFVWLIQESSYGTQVASPVVGTSQFLVPLNDSNSFTMAETPNFMEVAYGGGIDTPADLVEGPRGVAGELSCLGYPALTAFLMGAAVTRVNAAQTAPWVTTEPQYDLASFTAWHFVRTRSGSWVVQQYPGVKVAKLSGSCSRQDPKLKLKLSLVGQKELPNAADGSTTATAPAGPTEAQYPAGPYTFNHLAGGVTGGGGSLSNFDDVSFDVTNKLVPCWWENRWLAELVCLGREAEATVGLKLTTTPDLRSQYQAATRNGFGLAWNNGTKAQTLSYGSNSYVNKLPYDLPLGKPFRQPATFRCLWDPTANSGAGGDVSVSNT